MKQFNISIDERLDLLMNCKLVIYEVRNQISMDIEELINREADMINRGRSEQSLSPLRK